MAKKRLYILRHGETFATKKNTWYGLRVFSAPILEEGKGAIKRIGEHLKDIGTDYCVSSKILRCRQTVEIIRAETGKDFVFDSRLNEYFFETLWQFRSRVKSFLRDLEKKGYENVLICTHGAVIAAILNMITTKPLPLLNRKSYPNPGVLIIIEYETIGSSDATIQELDFNIK